MLSGKNLVGRRRVLSAGAVISMTGLLLSPWMFLPSLGTLQRVRTATLCDHHHGSPLVNSPSSQHRTASPARHAGTHGAYSASPSPSMFRCISGRGCWVAC